MFNGDAVGHIRGIAGLERTSRPWMISPGSGLPPGTGFREGLPSRMGHWFRIALGMVLAGWGAYGATVPEVALEDPIQAGPVFSEFQTVWESGRKTEILGPLAMWETTADERNWGVYPLMSYQSAPIVELEELDVLYPLFTWRKQGTE